MSLAAFLLLPLAAGAAAAALPRWSRGISLAALGGGLALAAGQIFRSAAVEWPWIPSLGVSLSLAIDGLSATMLLLTFALGLVAVASAWKEITERVGLFHLLILWTVAGVAGVFLARDLFAFYVFWELMILPMFLLILLWGHGDRARSATRFFIYTQVSSLLTLVAIIALAVLHRRATGSLTFQATALASPAISSTAQGWLFAAFLAALLVKLPAFPLHGWLPDAHTDAPTAASVLLAGILLKTGAYGLIRFAVPLFPAAAARFGPWLMLLAVAAILYGALAAYRQTDFKRLVAYTSVSHMGFVLLGVFAAHPTARHGAVLQMVSHGFSTGALFVLAGALEARLGTRDLERMGGLWSRMPRLSALGLFFALASLGLPGLGNFAAEFLVLGGTFRHHPATAAAAALGLVLAAAYALRFVQLAFHGPSTDAATPPDLSARETVVLGLMAAALLWLGLSPQPVLDLAAPSLRLLEGASHVRP